MKGLSSGGAYARPLVAKKEGSMDPSEKKAIKEKLAEKGIDLEKAGEELNVPADILALYLTEDSNPIPKRIVDGLQNMLQ